MKKIFSIITVRRNIFWIFLMTIIFSTKSTTAQIKSSNGTSEEHDITSKVDGVSFKNGITKIQEFSDGSYLAMQNQKGQTEYVLVKDGKYYYQSARTASNKNETSSKWQIGLCTLIVYRASVTLGPQKITATMSCK